MASQTHAGRPVVGNPATVELLDDVLRYGRERDYIGWDYADGMSSKIRRQLPVDNKWINLCFQELAKRAPVNLRPLLLVEQRRNFKGAGLFAMANLRMARLLEPTAPDTAAAYREEADALLEWLIDNRSRGYSGFCGGHNHQIQGLSNRGYPNDADVVSTAYAVKALLEGEMLDERYPEIARTAEDFVIEDLEYREVPTGAVVDYYESHPDDSYTINAGALTARLFLDIYERYGGADRLERARKILDHVAVLQTDMGGWYYREPPSASHLSMDNHHNGFIIEAFQRYHAVADSTRYADTLGNALAFYRRVLFGPDGAPHYDETNPYPHDTHASAQGILVFTYTDDVEFARRILEWTLQNLYAGDGRFYFRKHKWFTKRYTLMRWCQAWMAYAIGEHLVETSDAVEPLTGNRR